MSDINDSKPVVTTNGKSIYVSYNGNWNTNVKLTEGLNTIEIIATNLYGKSTAMNKTVTYINKTTEYDTDNDNRYDNYSTNDYFDSNINSTSNNNTINNAANMNKEENIDDVSTIEYDYERICNYCGHNDGKITLTLEKGVKTDVKWNGSSCPRENWNYITLN